MLKCVTCKNILCTTCYIIYHASSKCARLKESDFDILKRKKKVSDWKCHQGVRDSLKVKQNEISPYVPDSAKIDLLLQKFATQASLIVGFKSNVDFVSSQLNTFKEDLKTQDKTVKKLANEMEGLKTQFAIQHKKFLYLRQWTGYDNNKDVDPERTEDPGGEGGPETRYEAIFKESAPLTVALAGRGWKERRSEVPVLESAPSLFASGDVSGQGERNYKIAFVESAPWTAALAGRGWKERRSEVPVLESAPWTAGLAGGGWKERRSEVPVLESAPWFFAPRAESGQEERHSKIAFVESAPWTAGLAGGGWKERRSEVPVLKSAPWAAALAGRGWKERRSVVHVLESMPCLFAPKDETEQEETRSEITFVESASGMAAPQDEAGLEEAISEFTPMESASGLAARQDEVGQEESISGAAFEESGTGSAAPQNEAEQKGTRSEITFMEWASGPAAPQDEAGQEEAISEFTPMASTSGITAPHDEAGQEEEISELSQMDLVTGKAAVEVDGEQEECYGFGLVEPAPGKPAFVDDQGLEEAPEEAVPVYDEGQEEMCEAGLKNEVPAAYNVGEMDEGAAANLEYGNDNKEIPKEMKYEHLLAAHDEKIVLYPKKFECPICFRWIKENEGIILKGCLHVFCRICLTNAVKRSVEIDVSCPYQDKNYNCKSLVLETELEGLLSENEYEDRLNKALEHAKASTCFSFHCKKPGCNGCCMNDGLMSAFSCPVCHTSNCIPCDAIHEEMSCKEYIDMVSMKSKWAQMRRPQAAPSKGIPGRLITAEEYEEGSSKLILNGDGDQVSVEKKYEHFLALEKQKIVLYPNEIECPICFDLCKENEGVILKQCLHVFCKDCLINTIKISGDADVKCPFRDENYSCESFMLETEIQGLLSKMEYDERLKQTLEQAEARISFTFHCLKADCSGWCINEGGTTEFDCPVCYSPNCLVCKAIHEGISCNEYLDMVTVQNWSSQTESTETVLNNMVAHGTAMYCPQCSAVVQKETGCDHLVCPICKTQLCWATKGFRWGPEGTGDISGGCRCGVNGQKCHPSCSNCH